MTHPALRLLQPPFAKPANLPLGVRNADEFRDAFYAQRKLLPSYEYGTAGPVPQLTANPSAPVCPHSSPTLRYALQTASALVCSLVECATPSHVHCSHLFPGDNLSEHSRPRATRRPYSGFRDLLCSVVQAHLCSVISPAKARRRLSEHRHSRCCSPHTRTHAKRSCMRMPADISDTPPAITAHVRATQAAPQSTYPAQSGIRALTALNK